LKPTDTLEKEPQQVISCRTIEPLLCFLFAI